MALPRDNTIPPEYINSQKQRFVSKKQTELNAALDIIKNKLSWLESDIKHKNDIYSFITGDNTGCVETIQKYIIVLKTILTIEEIKKIEILHNHINLLITSLQNVLDNISINKKSCQFYSEFIIELSNLYSFEVNADGSISKKNVPQTNQDIVTSNTNSNIVTTSSLPREPNLKLAHSNSVIYQLTNGITTQLKSLKNESNTFTQGKIKILGDLNQYLLMFEKTVNENKTLSDLINSWLDENVKCQALNTILTRREILCISHSSGMECNLLKEINDFLKMYGSYTIQTVQQTIDINRVPVDILSNALSSYLSAEEINKFSSANKFLLFNIKKEVGPLNAHLVDNFYYRIVMTVTGEIFYSSRENKFESWHSIPVPDKGVLKCYLENNPSWVYPKETGNLWVASNTDNLYTLDLKDFHANRSKIRFNIWNKIALPSGFKLDRLIMTNLRNYKHDKACVFIIDKKNNQIFARGNNYLGALGIGKEAIDDRDESDIITSWEKVLLPSTFVLDEIISSGNETHYFIGKNGKIYVSGAFYKNNRCAKWPKFTLISTNTPTLLETNFAYKANIDFFVGQSGIYYTTHKKMGIYLKVLNQQGEFIIEKNKKCIVILPDDFEIEKIRRFSKSTFFIGKNGKVFLHNEEKSYFITLPTNFILQDIIAATSADPRHHQKFYFIGEENRIYIMDSDDNTGSEYRLVPNLSKYTLQKKMVVSMSPDWFAYVSNADLLFMTDTGQLCKIYFDHGKLKIETQNPAENRTDKPSCSLM